MKEFDAKFLITEGVHNGKMLLWKSHVCSMDCNKTIRLHPKEVTPMTVGKGGRHRNNFQKWHYKRLDWIGTTDCDGKRIYDGDELQIADDKYYATWNSTQFRWGLVDEHGVEYDTSFAKMKDWFTLTGKNFYQEQLKGGNDVSENS
jgi:hypothetical protein